MINGILWAVGAGIMLGLYALPEKYIKGYKYENTWFLFFFTWHWIVMPLVSSFLLIDNFCDVLCIIAFELYFISWYLHLFFGELGVQLLEQGNRLYRSFIGFLNIYRFCNIGRFYFAIHCRRIAF